jgi:hypothetical protein
MTRSALNVLLIAVSALHSSPCLSQLSKFEQSTAFCSGVLYEMMEYYNHHPKFFILPPFSHQLTDAMGRRTKILDLTGLAIQNSWRPSQDQMMMMQVEGNGNKERKQCEEHTYPCLSNCLGALPSPLVSQQCRSSCEGPERSCASSFSCLQ